MTKLRTILAGTIVAFAPNAFADGYKVPAPFEAYQGNYRSTDFPPNTWYFEVGAGPIFLNLPRWQYGATSLTSGTPLFDFRSTASGPFPVLTIGRRLPDMWLPPWLGVNPRIEISGTGYNVTSSKTTDPNPLTTARSIMIGGTGAGNFNLNSGFTSAFRAEQSSWEIALRLATDHVVTSNLIVTTGIAVFGGSTWSNYRLDIHEPGGVAGFDSVVQERLNAHRYGGALSLGARFAVDPNLSLLGGGSIAIVSVHAHLRGTDCSDDFSTVAGCQFNVNQGQQSEISTSRTRVGFRVGAQGGVGYDLGFVKLKALGFFRFDSATPEVRNPSVPGQAARVGFIGRTGYGGTLSATVTFFGP